ncbi:hypothetical protein SynWH8103_01886 [Synechococcus sp. WH 8103]|nr:hypothetical protein SynWH8103_01886 [Synechococcus sp. WH 8103]
MTPNSSTDHQAYRRANLEPGESRSLQLSFPEQTVNSGNNREYDLQTQKPKTLKLTPQY